VLKEGYEYETQIGVLSGSESEGFPQLSAADNDRIRTMVLQDACPVVVTLPVSFSLLRQPTLAECAAFQDGAVRTGLQFLMQRYLQQSATIMRMLELTTVPITSTNGTGTLRIPPTSTSLLASAGLAAAENDTVVPYSIPALLASPAYAAIEAMGFLYLRPAYWEIMHMYRAATVTALANYAQFVVVMFAVCLILISLSILLFYLPAISRMDRDVHAKRALLTLLPPPALHYVPQLRAFVERVLAAAGMGTASAAQGGMVPTGRASGRGGGRRGLGGGGGGGGDVDSLGGAMAAGEEEAADRMAGMIAGGLGSRHDEVRQRMNSRTMSNGL